MNEPLYVKARLCFALSQNSRWVRGQYQPNNWMTNANASPEIWKISISLFFLPKNAPKIRNNIQRKWENMTMSAKILNVILKLCG